MRSPGRFMCKFRRRRKDGERGRTSIVRNRRCAFPHVLCHLEAQYMRATIASAQILSPFAALRSDESQASMTSPIHGHQGHRPTVMGMCRLDAALTLGSNPNGRSRFLPLHRNLHFHLSLSCAAVPATCGLRPIDPYVLYVHNHIYCTESTAFFIACAVLDRKREAGILRELFI
jgi:hypothetical protein